MSFRRRSQNWIQSGRDSRLRNRTPLSSLQRFAPPGLEPNADNPTSPSPFIVFIPTYDFGPWGPRNADYSASIHRVLNHRSLISEMIPYQNQHSARFIIWKLGLSQGNPESRIRGSMEPVGPQIVGQAHKIKPLTQLGCKLFRSVDQCPIQALETASEPILYLS